MAEYKLNDKQKQLLQALVPGLKQAQIGLQWQVIFGAHITVIFENGKTNLRSLGWHQSDPRDFEEFVAQGFFRVIKNNQQGQTMIVGLNDTLIIQTVENRFLLPS